MPEGALIKLAGSTAEAVAGVLRMFAPGQITVGDAVVCAASEHPLEDVAVPAVVASASYVDGVTGGNLLAMTVAGARRLAAAMTGAEPPAADEGGELSELERSAVSEAMNQMMAAAATAVSSLMDTEVDISVPETQTYTSAEDAMAAFPRTPHATRVAVTVCGEPCRLVGLVPNAFIVRMARAMDELTAEYPALGRGADDAQSPVSAAAGPDLAGVKVRVSAELGRARMHSAAAVALPPGAVVELDRQADDAIDVLVNGRPFATGRLVVVDGSEWAVRIEAILGETQVRDSIDTEPG